MADQLVRLTQQRHEQEVKFQNVLVGLLRNWRSMHPADVTNALKQGIKIMEGIDAIEGALAVVDNHAKE